VRGGGLEPLWRVAKWLIYLVPREPSTAKNCLRPPLVVTAGNNLPPIDSSSELTRRHDVSDLAPRLKGRGESNPGRRGAEGSNGSRNRELVSFRCPGSALGVPSFGHRVPKTSALSCQSPPVSNRLAEGYPASQPATWGTAMQLGRQANVRRLGAVLHIFVPRACAPVRARGITRWNSMRSQGRRSGSPGRRSNRSSRW